MNADICIVGGGAAGMAAAVFAAEAAPGAPVKIVVCEGAKRPGAKILVSGGGRCNVTNARVSVDDYNGEPKPIIRNVLRTFDNERTIQWMKSLGAELQLEEYGKYFPKTGKARTVLDALLRRMEELGVVFLLDTRVRNIAPAGPDFEIALADGTKVVARRVIVATGGLALPKSGSDGAGLGWMRSIGHVVIPTTPALAPLVLQEGPEPGGRFADFSGLTLDVRLRVVDPAGRILAEELTPMVFTHFGVSGPGPMNLSRHLASYRLEHNGANARLLMGHPNFSTVSEADSWLKEKARLQPRRAPASVVAELFPDRLARALADEGERMSELTREQRLKLAERLSGLPLPVTGDRGYAFAETTAGGVSLREIDWRTMESRLLRGMHLCGEILDVDGRIGGYSFQWAWASGYLAGRGAVQLLHAAASENKHPSPE